MDLCSDRHHTMTLSSGRMSQLLSFMNRPRKPLNMLPAPFSSPGRLLAVLLALDLACIPVTLRADCGVRECECAVTGSGCCPSDVLRTCCGGEACGSTNCDCEVRESDSSPIPPQQREQFQVQGGWHVASTACVAPVQQDRLDGHSAYEAIRSTPALRILYCVWRN